MVVVVFFLWIGFRVCGVGFFFGGLCFWLGFWCFFLGGVSCVGAVGGVGEVILKNPVYK